MELSPQQKAFQKRLKVLMKNPENQICCDCSEKRPTWACIIRNVPLKNTSNANKCESLGGFCCLQCSGSHRRLGVHISFVRSIKLDEWKESEIESMERGGNLLINEIYESDSMMKKPVETDSLESRQSYIQDKYEKRIFVDPKVYNLKFNSPGVKKKFINIGNHHTSKLQSGMGQSRFKPKSSNVKALVLGGFSKIICYNHCGRSRDLEEEESVDHFKKVQLFNFDATDIDSVYDASARSVFSSKKQPDENTDNDNKNLEPLESKESQQKEGRAMEVDKESKKDQQSSNKKSIDSSMNHEDILGKRSPDSKECTDRRKEDKCENGEGREEQRAIKKKMTNDKKPIIDGNVEQTPIISNQRRVKEGGQYKGSADGFQTLEKSKKEESGLFTITIDSGDFPITHKLTKEQMNKIASDLMRLSGGMNSESGDQEGECKESERLSDNKPTDPSPPRQAVRSKKRQDGNKNGADQGRGNRTSAAPSNNTGDVQQQRVDWIEVDWSEPEDEKKNDDCSDFESIWSSVDSIDSSNSHTKGRKFPNSNTHSRTSSSCQKKGGSRPKAEDSNKEEQQELFDFESRASRSSSGKSLRKNDVQQHGASSRNINAKVQHTAAPRRHSGSCGQPRDINGVRSSNRSKRDLHDQPSRAHTHPGRDRRNRPSNEQDRPVYRNNKQSSYNGNGDGRKNNNCPPNSRVSSNQNRRPSKEGSTRENERSRDERERRRRDSDRGDEIDNRHEYYDNDGSESGSTSSCYSSPGSGPGRRYSEGGGSGTRQRTVQVDRGQSRSSTDEGGNNKKSSSNRPVEHSRSQSSRTNKRLEKITEYDGTNQDRERDEVLRNNRKAKTSKPTNGSSRSSDDTSRRSNSLRNQGKYESNRNNLVEPGRSTPQIDDDNGIWSRDRGQRRSKRASMGQKISVSMVQ